MNPIDVKSFAMKKDLPLANPYTLISDRRNKAI